MNSQEHSHHSIRPRLTPIGTDEDLLLDQQNFLENLQQQQQSETIHVSERFEGTFEPESHADDETPTSAQLPLVGERKVQSRRRRRRQAAPTTSFPKIPQLDQTTSSAFARSKSQPPESNNEALSSGNTSHTFVELNTTRTVTFADEQQKISKPSNDTNSQKIENDVLDAVLNDSEEPQLPSGDAHSLLSSMTQHEIHSSQVELMEKLQPEMVSFLKEKWKQRGIGQFSNDVGDDPSSGPKALLTSLNKINQQSSTFSSTTPIQSISTTMPEHSHLNSDITDQEMNGMALTSTTLPNSRNHVQNIRESLLIPKQKLVDKEAEKMLWATDSRVKVPSDAKLDEILQVAVQSLGEIASQRFDLNGRILTNDEIESLPTHLGLHHHGSSPSSAGYTLSDILTLMRSSLSTQRGMALKILSALVRQHTHKIADPLAESGALSLAFAPFPFPRVFHSAVTYQLLYVDTLYAFVTLTWNNRQVSDYDNVQLLPDLFFASPFYSPPTLQKTQQHDVILNALAQTDCITTLTRIAYSNASSAVDTDIENGVGVIESSLIVIRDLVTYDVDVCRNLVFQKPIVNMLQTLALIVPLTKEVDEHLAKISLLACDIIAQVFIRVAWDNNDSDQQSEGNRHGTEKSNHKTRNEDGNQDETIHEKHAYDVLLGPSLFHHACQRLSLLLADGEKSLSPATMTYTAGFLRIVRAGLAFQHGAVVFSASVQAVCRLVYEDNYLAREAYLTLEAYVHCLHEFVARSVQDRNKKDTTERREIATRGRPSRPKTNGNDPENVPSIVFIEDQVSNLVPAALTAVKVFAGGSGATNNSVDVRAAAGHFAATLIVVYRVPLGNDLLAMVLSACAASCLNVSKSQPQKKENSEAGSPLESFITFGQAGSLCHAGARLLARVKLEQSYVKREIDPLIKAAKAEKEIIETLNNDGVITNLALWRPVANACAEWLGLYSRTKTGRDAITYAVEVLPLLTDIQVIVDLLSRSILNVDCLTTLDKNLPFERARTYAQQLIPVAYDGLLNLVADQTSKNSTENDESDESPKAPFVTVFNLLSIWSENEDCWPSLLGLLSLLHEANVIASSKSFNLLLCVAPSMVEKAQVAPHALSLLSTLVTKALKDGERLIIQRSDTILSTSSTETNPKLADGVLQLADQLVSHGPQPEQDEPADPHSSVILNLMCSNDVDISLRLSLWDKTIDGCGGALLYMNAKFDPIDDDACGIGSSDDELILSTYVRSIEKGFLDASRCPDSLAKFVMRRLQKAMLEDEDRECVRLLRKILAVGETNDNTRARQTFASLFSFL